MIFIDCNWVSTRLLWSVNVLFPSLSTASNHLSLGLSTGLLPSMYPFSALLGTFPVMEYTHAGNKEQCFK